MFLRRIDFSSELAGVFPPALDITLENKALQIMVLKQGSSAIDTANGVLRKVHCISLILLV